MRERPGLPEPADARHHVSFEQATIDWQIIAVLAARSRPA